MRPTKTKREVPLTARQKLQAERDKLVWEVQMLRATLEDTERILFDPVIELALRNLSMVRAVQGNQAALPYKFACDELKTKRSKLIAARGKR